MKKSKLIGFNAKELAESMMANAVAEQNRRLVEYAEGRIMLLGETIASYTSRHNMDDTGNLLDSLCWGVCYDGKMVQSGFYRNKRATTPSYLHGWSTVEFADPKRWKKYSVKETLENKVKWVSMDAGEPVNGHELAEAFLAQAHKRCKANQWMVFFAVLAPYWGYWERGFNITPRFGGNTASRFLQFAVMTQFKDHVSAQLKPAHTSISIPKLRYSSRSLYAQAKKNL